MRLTKALIQHLAGYDFYNVFEVTNTICDHYEGHHEDNRDYKTWSKYTELAIKYINKLHLILDDEERTRKRENE